MRGSTTVARVNSSELATLARFHTVNNNRIKFSSKYKDFDRTVGEALSSEMVRALTHLKDRLS